MTEQDGATGVATVAKDQAGQVGRTAADAGGQVAQTTKEQAQNVVGEAKQQARDLVGEARTQVQQQAGTQKGRAVGQLRSLGDELHQMTEQGGQSGLASEVARQVAERSHGLADYLDQHEPADILDGLRQYARRRPVVFLAGAAVAGVLAGRLTRNLASKDDGGGQQQFGSVRPAPALEPAYQPTEVYPATGYDQGTYAPTPGYADPAPGFVEPGYADPGYAGQPAPGYTGQAAPGYGEPGYVEPGYVEPGYAEPGYAGQPAPGQPGYGQDSGWRTP